VALDEAGVNFEAVDIFRRPLSADDLRSLLDGRPAADLFSWRSPQARQRGITPGSRSDEELLALMAQEPRLIRRPVVRAGNQLVIGADKARIRELVSG
jgi:arsenate reductase